MVIYAEGLKRKIAHSIRNRFREKKKREEGEE